MIINTNKQALVTLNSLGSATSASSKNMEGLSTGKRVNSAADDAAGSAVASRMTTQVRGMNQAIRNANDGIAMLKTYEGTLASMGDIMQRMREISIQSANGTYSDADRSNLNAEFQQLWDEIDRISESARFNGTAYLTAASAGDILFQISDVANDTLKVTFSETHTGTLFAGAQKIDTQADSQLAIEAIDLALDELNSERALYGAAMNRLEYTTENLANTSTNLSDARSRIVDLDMAAAMSDLTKNEILTQSSVAMLGKANQAPQSILQLLQ